MRGSSFKDPNPDIDLAPSDVVILGCCAFAVFWVLSVFPAVPFLPFGRTAGSLIGAMLMVVLNIISPEEAYDSIDLSILGLLFGTMLLSVYLEKADMFKYLGKLLSWKCQGAKDLLCRICVISAISSALFTNDTSCIVLTEFVLKTAWQNNIKPHPFLLALASSANIGSSATPIGNPQNLVIAMLSNISFWDFLCGILPAMLVGVAVNILILLCMYWRLLSVKIAAAATTTITSSEANSSDQEDAVYHLFPPPTMSHLTYLNSQEWNSMAQALNAWRSGNGNGNGNGFSQPAGRVENFPQSNDIMESMEDATPIQSVEVKNGSWKRLVWKSCVYIVTTGMLIGLLMGFSMSWTTVTAALVLVVLDFKDAGPCLDKVSYSLLVFFSGMFITVEGFNRTGLPSTLWNITQHHMRIDHLSGIVLLSLLILVLSNVISNVPTVLLLGTKVAASAAAISRMEERKSWLILAWVSTIAGNFSLLGSAANLIVCEKARNSEFYGYNLSFWRHLKFGVPSTLIVIAIGLKIING